MCRAHHDFSTECGAAPIPRTEAGPTRLRKCTAFWSNMRWRGILVSRALGRSPSVPRSKEGLRCLRERTTLWSHTQLRSRLQHQNRDQSPPHSPRHTPCRVAGAGYCGHYWKAGDARYRDLSIASRGTPSHGPRDTGDGGLV
ncbi:hypothetical protein NDU88_001068 [Pleurodeles waltl]|uniref:Uncharacterized protein n=1 Tax=Pleurodeles waltl TaxID=8319 RepID=A0AAV7P5P8_PLEWA|nr:hypothetical protein NDU88_001068 [Pleurodeles waltl]